uniref:hypothetical protein n=1 Tax=Algoriphagus sp. TaxID=1872435 RepID=UPI0040472683
MSNHEQKKYYITIDPTPQKTKPPKTDKSIGEISKKLNLVTGLTINEVATIVDRPYSYTWSGGIFNGSPSIQGWQRQSVIGLDFDNEKLKISPEDVIQRFVDHNITPQLLYRTFSSSDNLLKFRVVIFLDSEIVDPGIQKIIFNGMKQTFPEADSKCFSLARFFFGGTSPEILSYQPVSTVKLFEFLSITQITFDKGRTRLITAPLQGCSVEVGELEENLGEKKTILYIKYRSSSISPSSGTLVREGEEQVKIDWTMARSRVKILDQFFKGEWLHHDQLFGLATNLINVKGGRKMMKETMTKFNEQGMTQYTENNFNILPYLNIVNYPPQSIHTFSLYQEDSDLHDLIGEVKEQRGKIKIISKVKKINLVDAENKLKNEFQKVITNTSISNRIHLFKLPTAIGKTKLITSVTGCTIALPTNSLKNEVKERMTIDCKTSPDPVIFKDAQINRMIDYYYSIGLPKKAVRIIYDIVSNNNHFKVNDEDRQLAQSYINQVEISQECTESVVTTHSRALYSQFNHDTLIFDEDPLNSLVQIKKIRISDLIRLEITLQKNRKDLTNVINLLRNANQSEIITTPVLILDLDEMIKKVSETYQVDSNLFGFFSSSYFVKDWMDADLIHYVIKKELPKDKKIIILSATVSPFIYSRLLGDQVEVFDVGEVEQKGKVIQYTKRSCSRNTLNRYVTQISKEVGDKKVITFKSFTHQFTNAVEDIYFGNCSGYDSLAGQDITVVGTPHHSNVEYLMVAKVLGVEFKTSDTSMSYQKIEFNGFSFKFYCFDNEVLREIQLALIESDLIQAVGRARTLRTSATVELYSNFPLRITDRFIY